MSFDKRMTRKRNVLAFWCLGLLNNFLYVVMNAGANNINEAGIGFVYLANILPCLLVKSTGPYWFHFVSYRLRIWTCAASMVLCLFIVAWGESPWIKLLGVGVASFQSGIGEASLLGMASLYDARRCLASWSSGTGFAGIGGYAWSILFGQVLDACFQLELMVGLWIPVAWLVIFHCVLDHPGASSPRLGTASEGTAVAAAAAEGGGEFKLDCHGEETTDSDDASVDAEETTSSSEDFSAADMSCGERLNYTLTLWKYMLPLFMVYAAEYIIQAGMWASMGFPDVHDPMNRHRWYQWANFAYQVGVFISRSLGGLRVLSVPILWAGPVLQIVMLVFFWFASSVPFGDWYLIGPALIVGLLGGFVYVQAFVLISQKEDKTHVELALSTASLADTLGIICADIVAVLVQGCLFGMLAITDKEPNFKCGYDIWEPGGIAAVANASVVAHSVQPHSALCFPGVQ